LCGIAGTMIFANTAHRVEEALLCRMRDSLAHRGPDGAGTWIAGDGKVGLGHRRLSIIDVSSAAAQPMSNEDGTIWLTYNGEIYNHAEIRSELQRLGGHRWKTDHSDTEVLLHAFEEWGIDCVHKLRGMFAFALWDAAKRQLWLVRDRIGIKPLYYSVHNGRISFASEIKALLADPLQKRAVNEKSLFHYLSFASAPAPETFFAGIAKVPPATWLRITEDGQIQEQRYWDVWDHTTALTGASDAEIAELLTQELRTLTALHQISDVEMGVFLSGGLDSNFVTALCAENQELPVKTFTIGYTGKNASYANETVFAAQMAQHVGAAYHECMVNPDDGAAMAAELAKSYDEPIGTPVSLASYFLAKCARDNGVVSCQIGEGSDELFWGYPWHQKALQLQKRYDGALMTGGVKRAAMQALALLGRKHTSSYAYLERSANGQPVFWGGAEVFTEKKKKALLSARLAGQFAAYSSWDVIEPVYRRFQAKAWQPSPQQWISYLDVSVRIPEVFLLRIDKMSMAVGLECRVPFLDHKLVELAFSIPEEVKTRNNVTKFILKKAAKGFMPDSLIHRKKQGLWVPIQDWYRSRLGGMIRSELRGFCREADFFSATEVQRLIDQGQAVQLWYLYAFYLWWKEYIA